MYGLSPQLNNGFQQNMMGMNPLASFGQSQGVFGLGQQTGGLGFGQQTGGLGFGQQANGIAPLLMQLMQATSMLQEAMMQQQLQALASPNADFGGGASGGGNPGMSDFLGGSSGGASGGGGVRGTGGGGGGYTPSASSGGGGGGTSSVDSSVPTATSSDFGNVPAWGAKLAQDASKSATGSGGLCFRYVRQALERAGVKGVGGASAYMAGDQLAKNPKFREIKVAEKDLKKLPAGAVVVWDRGNGHQHGHISIALGNGQEASDIKKSQTVGYGTKFRVFLPK